MEKFIEIVCLCAFVSKGKTSIINNFLDRSETIKPTLALEYSFGRRTGGPGQGLQRNVCNVWELGSLSNSSSLMNVPIKSHGFDNFAAVIVLNLMYPDRLWGDLEAALNGLKQALDTCASKEKIEMWKKNAAKRVGVNHPDLATLDLFPLPIVIIGGCYDKFQDFGKDMAIFSLFQKFYVIRINNLPISSRFSMSRNVHKCQQIQ